MPFTYEPEYDYTHTRSRHASKALLDDDVEGKGITLGGLNERFDPNAIDGDGDGLVQEGTPYERPATPSADALRAVGDMPSMTSPSTTGGSTGDDAPPQGIPRPRIPVDRVRPRITVEKPRPRISLTDRLRRRPKVSAKHRDKYGHPQRFAGMSPREIAERVVPRTREEHIALMVEARVGTLEQYLMRFPHRGQQGYLDYKTKYRNRLRANFDQVDLIRRDVMARWNTFSDDEKKKFLNDPTFVEFDYSPEAVDKARKIVEDALKESPGFRWAVDRFGMPPVAIHKQDVYKGKPWRTQWAGFHWGETETIALSPWWMDRIQGRTWEQGANVLPNNLLANIDNTTGGVLRHEFGHYIAWSYKKRGDTIYADREDMDMTQGWITRDDFLNSLSSKTKPTVSTMADALSNDEHFVNSDYGQKDTDEMFAEAVSAYLAPRSMRHYISPALERQLDLVFGAKGDEKPWEVEVDRGMRSTRRAADASPKATKPMLPDEPSIMDFDRPLKFEVGKTASGQRAYRFTMGDYTFDWAPDEDMTPADELRNVKRAVQDHFATSVMNGVVKTEGNAWFNRQVSALLFGYAVSEPNFRHYAHIGKWDREGFPEFDAILTGSVAKLDDDAKDEVQDAVKRALDVMQGVADSEVNTYPIRRVVNDPGDMFAVGDVVPIPLTNFYNALERLKDDDGWTVNGQVDTGKAILRVEGPHYSVSGGAESITQGNFRIKDIHVDELGNKIIVMEQVDVFSPKDGAFKLVPTDGQIAMRELGSKYPINVVSPE